MRDAKLRKPTALLLGAALAVSIVAPVAPAIPDSGGSVGTDVAAKQAAAIPAEWKDAGFEAACDCTTRKAAGRHLLSDDPHGCACGTDVMVVKDGCCYEVPLPQ